MPYNVLLCMLIVAFFRPKRRGTRWLTGVAFMGIYLLSNSYLVALLQKGWEYPVQSIAGLKPGYEAGIVLSGGLVNSCQGPASDFYDLENSSDRLLAGFFLYKRGICKKLILTGTDHELLTQQNRGEVQLAKSLLVEWGVPAEDVLLDTEARNTRENALFVAEMLKGRDKKDRYLLVTSASHMRRAKACFDRVGLQTDAFPSDFGKLPGCIATDKKILPSPGAFADFQRLWHEWIGMAVYKILGYC